MRRMPGADAPLAGDDEAADLAASRGSACRRTARSCSPRPGSCAPSRRTSRRRRRRRRASIASAIGMNAMRDRAGRRGRRARTSSSIARFSSSVSAAVEREVEAQVVGRHERAGLAGPLADDVAQRAVEQVRAGVVAHRVGAPLGIDHGLDASRRPRSRPWSVPRWTMRPPTGLCVSSTVNSSLPPPGLADDALVADLAAALGVERRPVEDDLGLAVAGQLVELHPVADDRDDPALGGRRLVAEERRVAGAAPGWRCTATPQLGLARELGLRAATGCARAARRARPRTRRGRRATPYSAASSTVRSIGKPYVSWSRNATSPGRTGRVGRQVLLAPADDRAPRRSAG